jgi:hypothetical protein
VIALPDHEADDVIGTLARKAAAAGLETVIVSGDKDFYQLIGDHICLLNPGPVAGRRAWTRSGWSRANAAERLGVPPEHVVDYLALIGDSSDNVPGAKGIGPEDGHPAHRAVRLGGGDPGQRGRQVSGKRAREALQAGADDVRLSRTLVTIQDDLPVELDLDAEGQRSRTGRACATSSSSWSSRAGRGTTASRSAGEGAGAGVHAGHLRRSGPEIVAAGPGAGRAVHQRAPRDTCPLQGDTVGLALAVDPGARYGTCPFRHRPAGMLALDGCQRTCRSCGARP